MPAGLIGEIGIAISPARSDQVYAFIEADEGEGGIYRSADGASTRKEDVSTQPMAGEPRSLLCGHSRSNVSRSRSPGRQAAHITTVTTEHSAAARLPTFHNADTAAGAAEGAGARWDTDFEKRFSILKSSRKS